MVINILLGSDGQSILRCWFKVPRVERGQDFQVQILGETLHHFLSNDVSSFIDCDFNDNVAFGDAM